MDIDTRIKMCILADKIHNDQEYAKKLHVRDVSHFKKSKRNSGKCQHLP